LSLIDRLRYGRCLPGRLVGWLFERGGGIALAIGALYGWLAPEHIVYGDNAEFSGLAALGGASHPPGYPLYVLWLRAWAWLPAESPAHAAALATVILASLQALVLHAACRAWGARPFAATIAVALFAAGPIAMRIHTEAEVFALNGLVVAGVLWIAAEEGPLRGLQRVAVLALIAGLGIANHLTCVLVAPIGLFGCVHGWREARASGRRALLVLGAGLGGLVLGLTPYLYLLVAPDTPVSWGKISDGGHVVRHFLRLDYGGPGQFSPRGESVSAWVSLRSLAESVGRSFLYVPAVVAIGACGWFCVRGDREGKRAAWWALAVAFLLAGPMLVLRFNLKPVHLGLYVVQRFHLLPITLLVIPLAVGLTRLAERVKIPERFGRSRALTAIVAIVGFAAAAGPSLSFVRRGHSPAIEQGLVNELVTLPPGSIVIGSTDEFHFGMQYLQNVLGIRRDVAVITTAQVGLTHYRHRVLAKTGIEIEPPKPGEMVSVQIAQKALATGRPLFIDPYQANIAGNLRTYPYGILFRVLPPDQRLPSVVELLEINKHVYEQFQFGYALPGPDDQLATQFHHHYARTWLILADLLGREGRTEDQAFALQMAQTLAPRAD
jgi:hypothetical protein